MADLDGLMVGEDDCPIDDIVAELFKNKTMSGQLSTKMGDLISSLGLSPTLKDDIDFRVSSRKLTPVGAYRGFLTEWVSAEEDGKASLVALNAALRKSGLNSFAGKLEKLYNKNTTAPPGNAPSAEVAPPPAEHSPASSQTPSSASANFKLVERQTAYITTHLENLLAYTSVNVQLLASVISAELLSKNDEAELDAEKNKIAKTKKFYEMMGNQPGSFPVLIRALKATKQSAVYPIFEEFEG